MGLTFKDGSSAGDYKKKASKKKKSSKSKSSSSSSSSAPTAASSSDPAAPVKQKGRGHIHPSGTVVTGMDTEFMQDLATGDALLVQNPNTLKDEMRIVQFIVSNTSLSVSSAFAFTTSSSVKYWFIKSPKKAKTKEEIEREKNEEFGRGIDAASGASKGTSVEVRVNNGHGGYKLIQQTVAEGTTREDMLYLRTSKKSDKFC
ncbi:hypothetical protein TeGR_g4351 [Tetraparma gracilis]|uniref:Uncharacterized protein n=1 Tax=Tetraparma gracilis TaxID=2962635 RepID=A0ABQ6M749_9STRA|nr:hypothetical protein TeGR_g4351 [Tetraparma gracilis]